MRHLRGFLYWLVTRSLFAYAIGMIFRKEVPCRSGYILAPNGASPYMRSGIVFGAYEYSERFLIKKWLPRNLDVVELGSSIGVVSRDILSHIHYSHQLVGVEALTQLAELAEVNISRLHPRRRWSMLTGAIAYNTQQVIFDDTAEHVAGRIVGSQTNTCTHGVTVQAITLHNIIQQFDLCDYSLVMDIEGAEHAVIVYDIVAIERCQCLITELHGSEYDKHIFCRTLTSFGMKMVERKHSVVAFVRA